MFEQFKIAVAQEDAKESAMKLENINNQLENSSDENEKDELFRKAEQVEQELERIESMMGISAEEILSFYEMISPQDAQDIVEKTIQRIPLGLMKGTLWTVDNLREFGGKIMLWASMKSPREAAMVAASVMILTLGSGQIVEAAEVDLNAGQESISELEVVTVPSVIVTESEKRLADDEERENHNPDDFEMNGPIRMMNGEESLFRMNENGRLKQESTDNDMKINGERAGVLEENSQEKIYGNGHSINSRDVHVGTIRIEK
jgi:hypothetical protein